MAKLLILSRTAKSSGLKKNYNFAYIPRFMCGIAGFIDLTLKSTEAHLVDMSNSLIHRGPDGHGYYFDHSAKHAIGLGHRRLSIIDLNETGKQPMHFEELSITFNGEIYNYKEIRDELSSLGHSFVSSSDTEVILHAYGTWGIEAIHKFIGMFAFVLVDKKKKVAYFVRDRAGVKPLYYYMKEGLILFSSELKAFTKHPFFDKNISLDAVASYMQYGNVPCPYSIFENTFKLKPGHYLEIQLENLKVDEFCYWNVNDFYSLPKLEVSFEEAKKKTIALLESAFNYRMVADVPVGVFLSGGYDSSCVTAVLSKTHKKLNTFTIGFNEKSRDEAPEAKKIADYLGTNHTELYCTEKELLDLIDELPYYYDEPFGDSSSIPTILVSRLAREHVTVVLSADGGDELFAGYYKYGDFFKVKAKIHKVPKRILKLSGGILSKIPAEKIPIIKHRYNFKNRYEKLKDILKDPTNESILNSLNQQFTNKQVSDLFQSKINHQSIFFNGVCKDTSALSYLLAIDYQTYLNDDILQKVDRATMSVSLEGREPFIDHRIVEYVAQLPDSFKFHNGEKKWLLKEITHEFIPKELMERPKKGFAIPMAEWLQNELKDKVEEFINEKDITKQAIFNWTTIKKIKDEFYLGKIEHDMKIWYILMFQMWYKKWME